MEKILKKTAWVNVIISVLFAAFGMFLVYNPIEMLKVISIILGVVFILVGGLKIIDYFIATKENNNYYNDEWIFGIIAIVIGLVTFCFYDTIETIFSMIISVWILYSGLTKIRFAVRLKKEGISTWLLTLIISLIIILFSIVTFFQPETILVSLGLIVFVYAILDCIENIIYLKYMNQLYDKK